MSSEISDGRDRHLASPSENLKEQPVLDALGRTKRLRDLMEDYQLTRKKVAEILNRQIGTIYHWHSGKHIQITQQMLELLEFKLQAGVLRK